jgi:archaellum component FlaG (FlaF/FlaG flagellin family)
MVDENGTATFSRVVNIRAASKSIVKLGPNPLRNVLYIHSTQKITEVRVFDLKGSLVKKFAGNLNNKYQLDNLRSGTHMMQVVEESGTTSTHMMVKE